VMYELKAVQKPFAAVMAAFAAATSSVPLFGTKFNWLKYGDPVTPWRVVLTRSTPNRTALNRGTAEKHGGTCGAFQLVPGEPPQPPATLLFCKRLQQ
jgi:hypothetical protein